MSKYKRLTTGERFYIYTERKVGISVRKIATAGAMANCILPTLLPQ